MKKFTMTITESDSGVITIGTECHGFNGNELVGLFEMKKLDLLAQMNPDTNFKRYILNPDGTKTEIVEGTDG